MVELEDQLSRYGQATQDTVPPAELSRVRNRSRPRRARRFVAAAALVVVGAIIVSVLVQPDPSVTTSTGPTADGSNDPPVASSTPEIPSVESGATEEERLVAARVRWEAAAIDDYVWTVDVSCFCPPYEATIRVTDGEAGEPVMSSDEPVEAADRPPFRTMEELFDLIEEKLGSADEVSVDYVPETGRVLRVSIDEFVNAVDDEVYLTVRSFGTTGDEPTSVDASALTESWGCAYAAHLSDENQTVAVRLQAMSGEVPSTPVELPAKDWTSTVEHGTDLFANWCTDLPDMNDPSPVVEFVWPIVEGTLTFDGATEMDCGNNEVRVHAIGLVAQRSDGERIEIGDLDITTASWGCFAG